jgi:hypothetical protein
MLLPHCLNQHHVFDIVLIKHVSQGCGSCFSNEEGVARNVTSSKWYGMVVTSALFRVELIADRDILMDLELHEGGCLMHHAEASCVAVYIM